MTSGSNGACTKGFNETTGASKCTLAEEEASCSATAICLARHGYDGPTGVGNRTGSRRSSLRAKQHASKNSKNRRPSKKN